MFSARFRKPIYLAHRDGLRAVLEHDDDAAAIRPCVRQLY
jgi:hypothetical protein